ncbi:hypothetical protein J31TS4_18520 [Paenibacillus sp. J31TS4]|uniref:DUF2268 domain-containing protein n=1 Tax=Paenibacillus sp. J31TS4 TaxID=2807195 RepID=UPI001B1D2A5B|nr:DUF2268 domain-containing putative Zn-dependent protease [Paenibacillus sp. J31TS4]GIP38572.1 hypothetical protein J31TS4_18520 [Paenibacillus sp. J31TS4]
MEIIIHDTYSLYKEMDKLPNEERGDFYENKLVEPFQPMIKIMNMPANPEAMGCLPLIGREPEVEEMLIKLKAANAWETARKALETAAERFLAARVAVPEKVVLGIYLGNPEYLANNGGITGFGGIPGYIQVIITPDQKSLALLPSIVAHEFHHNVLFYNAKWNFMEVTVAKYLAVEGLAESFAESLYGYEYLGPWVKELKGEALEKARKTIGEALNVKGFNQARRYIFGDMLTSFEGAEASGIPPYSGYAVGYHAVQSFLKNTGVSIEQATVLEGEEIMERSKYFK